MSAKPSPSRLPVLPYNPNQRRPKVAVQACDLAVMRREGLLKGLVKRIVRGGLHARSAELQLENISPAESEMSGQKVAADWRYSAALRALATIRKHGGPAVQINIGEQQVNVSG